ncbi:MAG TPA: DUF1214 domain-containing protein [Alphaproteobacteria bacterium]|nr:DUF1214 domain-containing protein [Alphaproteobacteria bacterium]
MQLFKAASLLLWLSSLAIVIATPTSAGEVQSMGPKGSDELAIATNHLIDSIRDSAKLVEDDPFYRDPENRAAGISYLNAMIFRTIEEDILLDRDFPYFSVMDFRSREGGDNPDQRYLYSQIRGGKSYRIWGRMGKDQVGMEFEVLKGYPWVPNSNSRTVATLDTKDLKIGKDGTFEVILSPSRQAGNWIENPVDADRVLLRQTYSKWTNARPGEVHIDPLGEEGNLKPRLTDAEMVRRLNLAANNLLHNVVPAYPAMVRRNNVEKIPANTLPAKPYSAVANGGPKGRYYSSGHFDLRPDQALLITEWPISSCYYQGIQLTNLWWSSIEYANRQSSLSRDQAYLSTDGAYHFVVSAADPGVQNWLDTGGFKQGIVMLRMDCADLGAFPAGKEPTARVVDLPDVLKSLPGNTPRVMPEARKAEIAARRKAIQIRSGL